MVSSWTVTFSGSLKNKLPLPAPDKHKALNGLRECIAELPRCFPVDYFLDVPKFVSTRNSFAANTRLIASA
jgi:hypothetical protein